MRGLRNPFRLRRAESIDTDDAFLTLFEPGILEVMPQETLWDSVHIIRSAAGGGKTSLIRMFTPSSLIALSRRGKSDLKTRELFQRMKDFDAVNDEGPAVLGVLLTCGPGYSMLQDLTIDQTRKTRYFFGLLNARITLAVMRGALEIRGLSFPDGLSRIRIASSKETPSLQPITFPCTGQQLYEWAEQREAMLCESLDSLGPLKEASLPGDDELYSLKLIEPGNITLDGSSIAKRVLLMMDDIHKLTAHQRGVLVSTVIDARSTVGIWIAERFEALSAQEMLSSGAEKGRDYGSTIEIESFWRGKHDKFEKLATKVATRRIEEATDTALSSFGSCLQETLAGAAWDQRFTTIAATVAKRVKAKYGTKDRFREWIRLRESIEGTPQQRATEWRALEILIERELNKKQKGLFDDQPLGEEELEQKDDSSLANAAELFLAREFQLPYYFGGDRIARLASLNIQQFLGLAGEVFEEATAAELLRRTVALSPERQHAIMKEMAKQLWDEIPRKVRHGRALRQFLESVGTFSRAYTYRPTAPNDPGVTGTAIRMTERTQLFDAAGAPTKVNDGMVRLGEMLASALSHNLLVAQLDYNCKQEKWMLLNLNRLLCVHFDLPLGYGLYKERPLKTLIQWLDRPYVESSGEGELL
jgi:hypothetical protein